MAETSSIPEEVLKMVGKEYRPPMTFEVEKGAIRKMAEAVGDLNPLYLDEEYAKEKGYHSVITLPLMLGNYGLPELQAALLGLPLGKKQVIARGGEFEYIKPVAAGDTLTVTFVLEDLKEEESRLGQMITIYSSRVYTNQNGEVVGREKMGISRY